MIDIYTDKKESKDWILQNDLYFNLNTGNEEMSQNEINLIQQVDEARLTPDKHIETKYGLGTIRNLSSGCKTLLNIVKIIILDMICFEYLILVFDKLVAWTGTGKTDKIKIREEVLAAVEDHRINLSKIDDEKTLQHIAGFKRYSTERVMKSLVGEFTQNEKWSVKGVLMGECWYKDCCVSEHPDNLRCGKPEVEDGSEKMRMLMQSEEVHKIISIIIG